MTWAKYYTYTPDATKAGSVDSTDFTALVKVTHLDLRSIANGGLCRADGFDIAPFQSIVGSTPTTLLKFERVFYDPAAGTVWMWVKQPTLSVSSGIPFIIAYGNAAITTDQQDVVNTWDANYKVVDHFGDGTTVNLNDSTSNANNLTNINSTAAATSPAGGGITLDGSTKSLERTANAPVTAPPLTIECLFFPTTTPGGSTQLVAIANLGVAGFVWSLIYKAGRLLSAQAIGATGVDTLVAATLNTWQTAQAVFTSDSLRTIYLNAANARSSVVTTGAYTANDLSIGAIHSSVIAQWFTGAIGGVRISNVVRSTSWLTAQHNTWTSPGTFLVESGPTTITANTNPVATITAPADLATVAQGASTTFTGSASDAEDGALTGASLQWTSSIDGSIGSGLTFASSALSLGTHTITLTATDSGSLTGTATRTLVVATAATAAAVAEAIAFVAANGGNAALPAFYDRRAGLTVATAKVTTIKDIIGAYGGRTPGPDIVQATSARQPTLVGTQGSGTEEITFNSVTDQWMASAADARFDASLNAPLYMYACYVADGDGPAILVASTETSDTTYPNFGAYSSGGEHMFRVGTAAAGSPSPSYLYPTGVANSATPRAVWGGHDIDLFSNANIIWQHALGGKQVARPNAITRCTAGSNKVVLGRLGAARGNFKFKALLLSLQRPTSTMIRNWYAYCVAHHDAQHITTFTDTWIFSSDSLGDGSHSSDPKTPSPTSGTKSPSYMAVHRVSGPGSLDTLGKDVGQIHRFNYAISGDNPFRMNTDFDYHIGVNDDGTRSGTGYVFIRGWENYIQSTGPSLGTMQTLAAAIKAKCEAIGWKCIHEIPIDRAAGANGSNANATGFHLGPGTGTNASAYGTLAIQFRDWLKDPSTYLLAGHYPPIPTGNRAEFLLTATAPNVAETGNGTIYDDMVHLKDAGYDIQKDVWKNYIDGLLTDTSIAVLTRLLRQRAA